mmetsp:Transcript_26873/g.45340  ORF Transcript_26873/g.45340 Transcript_26873/m.45340 type:complete len:822 (-) Transcript_26873:71-2536(-)
MKIDVSDALVQQMVSEYLLVQGYGSTFKALSRATTSAPADIYQHKSTESSTVKGDSHSLHGIANTTTTPEFGKRSKVRKSLSRSPNDEKTKSIARCPRCQFISIGRRDSKARLQETCKCCLHKRTETIVKDGTSLEFESGRGDYELMTDDKNEKSNLIDRLGTMEMDECDDDDDDDDDDDEQVFQGMGTWKDSTLRCPPATARELQLRRRSAEMARKHPQHDQSLFLQCISGHREAIKRSHVAEEQRKSDVQNESRRQRGGTGGGADIGSAGGNQTINEGSDVSGSGRGLTLDDTRRLRRALRKEEESSIMEVEEALNQLHARVDKAEASQTESIEGMFSGPVMLEIDLRRVIHSSSDDCSAAALKRTSKSGSKKDKSNDSKSLKESLDFRRHLRALLCDGKTEDVINKLLQWEADNVSRNEEALLGVRSTPTWVYLQVMRFVQALFQEDVVSEGNKEIPKEEEKEEEEQKEEAPHMLQEEKMDTLPPPPPSHENPSGESQHISAIDRVLNIGRQELFFLIDPNKAPLSAVPPEGISGKSGSNQYTHYDIGAGELYGVRSNNWHVWHFFPAGESGSISGGKKRSREDQEDESNHTSSDSKAPCSSSEPPVDYTADRVFACSAFEFTVLQRLVKDAVNLLVVPPAELQQYKSEFHNNCSNATTSSTDVNLIHETAMDVSPDKGEQLKSSVSGSFSQSTRKTKTDFFAPLPIDFFLSKHFVDIVADSVNVFVLSRKQSSPVSTSSLPSSAHSTKTMATSYHSALDLCLTQLHTLEVAFNHRQSEKAGCSSKVKQDRLERGPNSYNCTYTTYPVVWPNCHPTVE